ncbi:MAG: phenylacetic acid degradation protein PaaY [Alphaproteobacteria bacterium]|nr:phenylacetic acid degradation protein PaaY [Alphaproteobacteria bacterium]
MPIYAIDGVRPVVHPTAYVHPTAVLIGDVVIGPECYVAPLASLRGDFGGIRLERGANLQDCCVMHSFPETVCLIEEDGHIGHGAVLHGCRIGRGALIGMNAVVMDGAVIGERAIVAAMAFVKAKQHIPPATLSAGMPAKVLRALREDEMAWKHEGTLEYQELARRSLRSMVEVIPLPEVEADRPRLPVDPTRAPKS